MSKKEKQENFEHQSMNGEEQNKGDQQNQAEEQNNEQPETKEDQQKEASSEGQSKGQTEAGNQDQEQEASEEQPSEENEGEAVKKQDYDELYEKHIRLYSEFENFRKRTQKEKAEMKKEAHSELIGDLLPVLDDFERALNSLKADENINEEALQGIELIYNKFKAILKEKGLEEMEVLKQPFDAEYHEAVTKIEAPTEDQKGKVVDLIQKGYILEGKIVRHAKVVVGE